jgi:hypothetical protein
MKEAKPLARMFGGFAHITGEGLQKTKKFQKSEDDKLIIRCK